MKLHFDVTEDDYWAFQDHFIRNSLIIRQVYRKWALWGILPCLLFGFLIASRLGIGVGVPFGVALAALWVVRFLNVHKRGARTTRRLYGRTYRKLMEGVLGEAELELVPQGLRGTSHRGESIIYWDAIGEVSTTPTHTFIYVGKAQCMIIPQSRIISGNYAVFMQAFANVYAQRRDDALSAASPVALPTQPLTTSPQTTEEDRIELNRT